MLRIWFEPDRGRRGPMRGTLARLEGPVLGGFQSMAELAALVEQALTSGADDP